MPLHLYITGVLTLSAMFAMAEPPSKSQVAPPKLISPVNGATMDNGCLNKTDGITWDFDWSDIAGASAYHIRVWKNPAKPVVNNMTVTSSDFHYDSPKSYIINSNLTGWRWMVRAKAGGVWGPWSKIGFFQAEKVDTDCP